VSKSLLKIILRKFFDVWMRKIYTDTGNAVIDIGLSIYFISYLGILVFFNHIWTVGCLNLFLIFDSWPDLNKVGKLKDKS
jgi:hypothetical protein